MVKPLADSINQNFGVPSPGAVNDKLIAFFANLHTGNGSPEGVVSAPPGHFYFDLTNGIAYSKQPASGTGTTGWTIGTEQSGIFAFVDSRTIPYTLYVDKTNGSDSNDGRSVGKAKATIAAAVSALVTAGRPGKIVLVISQGGNWDVTAPLSFPIAVWIEALYPLSAVTIRRAFTTPNSRSFWDAVTTVAGTTITSPAVAAFTNADTDRLIEIYGAGTSGGTYLGHLTYVSGTQCTLSSATALARDTTTDPNGVRARVLGDYTQMVTDASMNTGTFVVTSPTAAWAVGDIIAVQGAGQGGQYLRGTVKSIAGTAATISAKASNTVDGVRCYRGINTGDMFTFEQGGGISGCVLSDTTTGSGKIGAAVKAYSPDQGAGVTAVNSDIVFDLLRFTNSDAAGGWEHNVDADGAWATTGIRRVFFRGCNFFGTRRPRENIRLSGCVHWWFLGGGMFSSPTAIRQGVYLLDPQKTGGNFGGAGGRDLLDVHLAGFECEGDYYVEGQYVTQAAGRLGVGTGGGNAIELAASSDSCSFTGPNVTSKGVSNNGTNNRLPYPSIVTQSGAGAITVDVSKGTIQQVTATGNITSITFSGLTAAMVGVEIILDIVQDGTGNRTYVLPTIFKTPTFVASTTVAYRDRFVGVYDGTNVIAKTVTLGIH